MATAGKKATTKSAAKKTPAKKTGAPVTKPRSFKGNVLIHAQDGWYFRAGSTGKLQKLTPAAEAQVVPLVEERLELAVMITRLLLESGLDAGPGGDGTIDHY